MSEVIWNIGSLLWSVYVLKNMISHFQVCCCCFCCGFGFGLAFLFCFLFLSVELSYIIYNQQYKTIGT